MRQRDHGAISDWFCMNEARPVNESESERDFFRERATIHTSEWRRAKFKTAHIIFSRATICNASHILALVKASVLLCVSVTLPICPSHSATVSKWCKLGSPNLHFTVRCRAKVAINQL